jgi:hypothetical protein
MKAIVFIFVSEDRGAHAPRVLFAAPPPQTLRSERSDTFSEHQFHPFGEAPNAAREARALPGGFPFWTWFIENPCPSLQDRQ